MFLAVLFTLSRSSPSVRNATHLRIFCFLEVIFAFGEIFANHRVLLQLDLHYWIEDSPKLPWGMQRIRGPFGSFCFKDHHYESFRLSRDSLSCATRSLALYILFKFIFLYLWYIALLSCPFHTFCFHQFFHMYQYRSPCEIFLLSLMIALIGESSEFNFKF